MPWLPKGTVFPFRFCAQLGRVTNEARTKSAEVVKRTDEVGATNEYTTITNAGRESGKKGGSVFCTIHKQPKVCATSSSSSIE